MAIDTEQKRQSIGTHFTRAVLPTPDGAIDTDDGAQLAWVYTGVMGVVESVMVKRKSKGFLAAAIGDSE